jgi:hypothetical protein
LTISIAERREKEEEERRTAERRKKHWDELLTAPKWLSPPLLLIPAQSDAVTKFFERLDNAKAN